MINLRNQMYGGHGRGLEGDAMCQKAHNLYGIQMRGGRWTIKNKKMKK